MGELNQTKGLGIKYQYISLCLFMKLVDSMNKIRWGIYEVGINSEWWL